MDIEGLLQRVGLGDRAGDRVKNYSKGMQQRLMVARSLVNSPKVLFLDEPTDGLDPVSSQAIREIIKDEARRGAAVLLTTHDIHDAIGNSGVCCSVSRFGFTLDQDFVFLRYRGRYVGDHDLR